MRGESEIYLISSHMIYFIFKTVKMSVHFMDLYVFAIALALYDYGMDLLLCFSLYLLVGTDMCFKSTAFYELVCIYSCLCLILYFL